MDGSRKKVAKIFISLILTLQASWGSSTSPQTLLPNEDRTAVPDNVPDRVSHLLDKLGTDGIGVFGCEGGDVDACAMHCVDVRNHTPATKRKCVWWLHTSPTFRSEILKGLQVQWERSTRPNIVLQS